MAPLGNLVRLHPPLHINELPAHPALDSLLSTPSEQTKESLLSTSSEQIRQSTSDPSQAGKVDSNERPNLISFMEEVLEQASLFIDDTLPATFKEGRLKKSPPSIAKVRLLTRNISMAEVQAIPWSNSRM